MPMPWSLTERQTSVFSGSFLMASIAKLMSIVSSDELNLMALLTRLIRTYFTRF